MVIKITYLLLSFLFFISCSDKADFNGKWKLTLKLQDQQLPVVIEMIQDNQNLSATLFNSSEKIKLVGTASKDKFNLEFEAGYAVLQGSFKDDQIQGEWIRTNKEDYKVEFTGVRSASDSLFKKYEKQPTLIDIAGKWKIELEKDKFGLGLFTQKGSRVQGSILTETGDYRYLDGYLENNKLNLIGFDGVFSFLVDCLIIDNQLKGTMYAGRSFSSEILGVRDELFSLADPNQLTKPLNDLPLKLKLNDIDGNLVDITNGEYKDKAKVIQLFGSWCPNCIDETHFFLSWRKENLAKLNSVKFLAVSFENTKTKEEALKNLRKLKTKLSIDYDITLADFDKSKKATDLFPIDKVNAFPTTLFLNKENKIIKIHTGFSGQATGVAFEEFKVDFNKTIDSLIQ